jgi:hypothetical protein
MAQTARCVGPATLVGVLWRTALDACGRLRHSGPRRRRSTRPRWRLVSLFCAIPDPRRVRSGTWHRDSPSAVAPPVTAGWVRLAPRSRARRPPSPPGRGSSPSCGLGGCIERRLSSLGLAGPATRVGRVVHRAPSPSTDSQSPLAAVRRDGDRGISGARLGRLGRRGESWWIEPTRMQARRGRGR